MNPHPMETFNMSRTKQEWIKPIAQIKDSNVSEFIQIIIDAQMRIDNYLVVTVVNREHEQVDARLVESKDLSSMRFFWMIYEPEINEVTFMVDDVEMTVRIVNAAGAAKLLREGQGIEVLKEISKTPLSRKIDWNKGFRKEGFKLKVNIKKEV